MEATSVILEEPLEFIKRILKVSISLFIVVDAIGNIPIFLSLTQEMKKRRRKLFRQAVLISFFLLMFFSMLGEGVLRFFNISIYSFAIAGGILLLMLSIRVLVGKLAEMSERETREFMGVVPLAFPLLVGPGAITTSILSIQNFGIMPTIIAVVIVSVANWIVLMNAEKLNLLLGKTGSMIVSKLMAIFIAAIAVEYIALGVKNHIIK